MSRSDSLEPSCSRPLPGEDEEEVLGARSDAEHSEDASSDEAADVTDDEGTMQGNVLHPLSSEELAKFREAQERTGIVYLSRIPPGMRPSKVRHLMRGYGEVGRVFLQQEDAKRAYLRRKHTSTKKAHYTEGWVEFADKKVARSVATMLNAQPIGGKKGTRWRDDVWTLKYLPRFKWNMLTEQISHEAAVHRERLRVELSQSKTEQRDYLRQVELARVLKKREEKGMVPRETVPRERAGDASTRKRKERSGDSEALPAKRAKEIRTAGDMSAVLSSIF